MPRDQRNGRNFNSEIMQFIELLETTTNTVSAEDG